MARDDGYDLLGCMFQIEPDGESFLVYSRTEIDKRFAVVIWWGNNGAPNAVDVEIVRHWLRDGVIIPVDTRSASE